MRAKILAAAFALSVGALAVMAAPAVAGTEAGPIPVNCNRACLKNLVNDYLKAVVAHDPSMLPLAKDVRFTENGQILEVGDGFWATASGIGHYKHYYVDPRDGEVGFMGTMREHGNLVLMGLRLRVQLGGITQIETTFYRTGNGPAWNDAGVKALDKAGKPEAIWNTVIPKDQRESRRALIATANKYFSALEHNDGKGDYSFFADDCNRIENGVATTNNPKLKMGAGDFNPAAMGCRQQFKTGFYGVVTRIDGRRFNVVDPEHGVVVAHAVFDQSGAKPYVILSNGKKFPMKFFSRPSSILITEAFKIVKGKIHRIEAIGLSVPYHMSTGWPGGITGH